MTSFRRSRRSLLALAPAVLVPGAIFAPASAKAQSVPKIRIGTHVSISAHLYMQKKPEILKNFGKSYDVEGKDPVCGVPVTRPKQAGQIWIQGGDIIPFSSAACTLKGVRKYSAEGKKFGAIYVVDQAQGIKVFADKAFFAVGGKDANLLDWHL